jgi:hypothetical protein
MKREATKKQKNKNETAANGKSDRKLDKEVRFVVSYTENTKKSRKK